MYVHKVAHSKLACGWVLFGYRLPRSGDRAGIESYLASAGGSNAVLLCWRSRPRVSHMQHAARAVYNATALRAAPVHRTVLGTVQVLRQRPCLVAGTTYARWSATVAMARLHTRTAVRLATTTTATLKTPCPSMSSWPLTYSVSLRQRASAARVEVRVPVVITRGCADQLTSRCRRRQVLARHMSSSASASSSSSSDSESESQLPESHDTNNEQKNQASSTPQQSSSSSSDAAASNDAAGSIGGSSSSSSDSSSKPKSIYEPDSDGDEAGQQLTTTNNAPLRTRSHVPRMSAPSCSLTFAHDSMLRSCVCSVGLEHTSCDPARVRDPVDREATVTWSSSPVHHHQCPAHSSTTTAQSVCLSSHTLYLCRSRSLLTRVNSKGNPYLGMFFVKNPEAYEQRSKRIGVGELKDLSQLHTVGTLARIESINRLQSGDGTPFASILVTSVARIRLTGEMPTAEDAPVAEAMVELFKVSRCT